MKLSDIVYEKGDYWVAKVTRGFEIYKTGPTHSTRCAVIGYTGEDGLARARAEIERRTAKDAV